MTDSFYIGSLKIHFYGVIIAFGVLIAVWISIYKSKGKGLDSEIIWDFLPRLLLGGLIGARLWHVFTPSKSMGVSAAYYFSHPIEIINIRQGGLGIPGAVIGGAIALFIFTAKRNLNFLEWADIISPGLLLAQSIGRWGNFFNQELYGPPTNLPWSIYIDPAHRLAGFEEYSYFHPLFLYESLWNLLNFLFLHFGSRKIKEKLLPGDVFGIYLIAYPTTRFFLEFIRLDVSLVASINANQLTMAAVAFCSLAVILIRHWKHAEKSKNTK